MATMKKFILLALTALVMVGCEHRTDAEIEEAERLNGFNIIVIDSCEYLIEKLQSDIVAMVTFPTKATVDSARSADKKS